MSKPTRKIQSVYGNPNVLVRTVFERAGDTRKLLCVALDSAKHLVLTLATTPYAMLTSIPGIRFVLAAGLAGELGDSKNLGKLDSLFASAANATWGVLQRKWRTVSGGLDLILDEAHRLGVWRKVMLELHHIDLPPRPRTPFHQLAGSLKEATWQGPPSGRSGRMGGP